VRILVVEDDKNLCQAMEYALKQNGYAVDVCHEGDDGLRWIRENTYDLALLDRMLPQLDGVSLLRRAREGGVSTPVLMITALGGIDERVEGLDAGADDYLVKPFAIEEMLARVRAMCRRPRRWEATEQLRCGDVSFDPAQNRLQGARESCSLSRRESELMEILLKNAGQTLPRGMLLSRVWGPDANVEEGNLDNYIHFLRRRLQSVGSALCIRTVRGVGYRLEGSDV